MVLLDFREAMVLKIVVIVAFVFLGVAAIQMKLFPTFSYKRPVITFILYSVTVMLQLIANIYIFFVDK
jgi:hypothetical protein